MFLKQIFLVYNKTYWIIENEIQMLLYASQNESENETLIDCKENTIERDTLKEGYCYPKWNHEWHF